jgi:soluble lytic murein transglycosylase
VSRIILIVGFMGLLFIILGTGPLLRWFYPIYFSEEIAFYAQKNQLDPFLITAVIRTESNFRTKAVSPKGATGLMQLMPETAQWIGEQIGEEIAPESLIIPEVNIKLGTWYLNNLLLEFQGNVILGLAAYNGGRGNVRQWLGKGIWSGELEDWQAIPFAETRDFIQRVIVTKHRYKLIYHRGWPAKPGVKGDTFLGTNLQRASSARL